MPEIVVVAMADEASVALAIRRAALAIMAGGVVAFPTDTVYGLACNPRDAAAVEKLFRIKRRSETKPVLLLIDALDRASELTSNLPRSFHQLARRFSPGPLTYVLPAAPSLPAALTAGTGKIGLRLPAFDFARRLAAQCGGAITATSANISDREAATSGREALEELGNELDLIVDGGQSSTLIASTVVDLAVDPPVVIREGAVAKREIEKVLLEMNAAT